MANGQISARKQAELNAARDAAVEAGVSYNMHYNQFALFRCAIDNDEKRDAVVFILDEQLNNVDINFEMANVIALLGDPNTMETLVYREFKLVQNVISKLTVRGREAALRFHNAMKALNADAEIIVALDQDTQSLMKDYQNKAKRYSQLCTNFNALPDNVDALIEAQLEENGETSLPAAE